jgi:archaellum component FlaC
MKKLTGNSEIEDSLDKLDKLTQEEVRMAAAELLKITHSVEENVQDVRGNVQDIDKKVQGVDDRVQGIDSDVKDLGSDVKDISSEVRGVDDKLDQVNRS